MQAVLGQKIEQSQRFLEDGTRVPVTVVSVADNPVVGIKTQEKNGYTAVQIGYGTAKNPTKPLSGIAKKANLTNTPKILREVKMTDDTLPTIGDSIKVTDVFKPGDIIQVTGMSKGKGFAGGVKRYGFRGGPRTHGQSDRERAPGSIGQTTTPGRVYKGKRMAGRMGHEQVTVKNLKVLHVDAGSLLIAGLVPGPANNILLIQKTGEDKRFVPLFSIAGPEPEAAEAPVTAEKVEEPAAEEVKEATPAAVSEKIEAESAALEGTKAQATDKQGEVKAESTEATPEKEEAKADSAETPAGVTEKAAEASEALVDTEADKKEEDKNA